MPKKNSARFVVLGLLSHEPMSGYDIKQRVDRQMSYFWDLSYGQIYPALRSLEDDGLVTKEIEEGEGGPDRKVYTVTPAGHEALREWLMGPVETERIRYEILLKLTFGSHVAKDVNVERLEAFRERNEENLRMMEMYEDNLRNVLEQSEDHIYILLTVLMGKGIYRSHITWADQAIELLKERS
jgi:DNA-binding PadR family transcriptional regulator